MMGVEAEEVLELINRRIYLHMMDNSTQVDYTLYDKETMRQVFRSQVEMSAVWDQPAMGFFNAARYAVAEDCGINIVSVESVPLDMLQTLSSIQHDPPLDEYPMPDQSCTMADVACMGYLKDDFLPVSDETAADLSQQGFTIYEANAFGNVVGPVEISKSYHELFVIARKDWENSPAFHEAAADRMNHQKERELAFLCQKQNCFAIYQLNHQNPDLRYIRHESLENLLGEGQRPRRENYELAYLEVSDAPSTMMGAAGGVVFLPDMVQCKPLVPVITTRAQDGTCHLRLDYGSFAADKEINAGYQIIAKVHVGPVEYALGELDGRFPSFVTWERTPANDGSGPPNYYWGHYFDNRDEAIKDFCGRASEKYEMLSENRKPSIKAQLSAKPVPGDHPGKKAKDLEVR